VEGDLPVPFVPKRGKGTTLGNKKGQISLVGGVTTGCGHKRVLHGGSKERWLGNGRQEEKKYAAAVTIAISTALQRSRAQSA
jgi:hypothetical protein